MLWSYLYVTEITCECVYGLWVIMLSTLWRHKLWVRSVPTWISWQFWVRHAGTGVCACPMFRESLFLVLSWAVLAVVMCQGFYRYDRTVSCNKLWTLPFHSASPHAAYLVEFSSVLQCKKSSLSVWIVVVEQQNMKRTLTSYLVHVYSH